jgi:Putative adhesin
MNNQEMQFADPEWRPPQQGNVNTDEQESYIPQPINTDLREQPQDHAVPPPQQERGYTGAALYADSQTEKIGVSQFEQRPRRRGSPWLWLIIVLIAFALMGRIASPFLGPRPHPQSEQYLKSASFSVGIHPTIVINDNFGTIQVQPDSTNTVTFNPTQEADGFGNTPQINYDPSPDGNTVTVTVEDNGFGSSGQEGVNLDVTVPAKANLQIKAGPGDIDVSGVNGQLSLETGSGSIDATQDTLRGQSTLNAESGDITLDSSLDPHGRYRLQTGPGDIEVTLPDNTSVHVDASTGSGDITSDFAEVNLQSPDAHEAHGDIGNPPRAELTLQTGSGSIDLNQQ